MMNKLAWTLVVVLSLVVAVLGYKFTAGEVKQASDGRSALQLTSDERNMLLLEMRRWLESSQAILAAAAQNDFATVEKVARSSGMAAEEDTPGELFRKIPAGMKALGFDTRRKFDAIADDAAKADLQHTVTQLSTAMNNCIACHAAFRFDEAKPN